MMMTTRGTRAAPTGPDARILRDARTGQAGPIQACPGDPVAPAFAPADLRIDAAALAAIEEAIEGSPFDTLLLRHRADVLWYLGRYEGGVLNPLEK